MDGAMRVARCVGQPARGLPQLGFEDFAIHGATAPWVGEDVVRRVEGLRSFDVGTHARRHRDGVDAVRGVSRGVDGMVWGVGNGGVSHASTHGFALATTGSEARVVE